MVYSILFTYKLNINIAILFIYLFLVINIIYTNNINY